MIGFIKRFLTNYSKIDFDILDLKNLRQYNYYKD